MSRDLSAVSDRDLLSRTDALARRQQRTALAILLHLGEIDHRRLYAPQGYSSLFDYCTRRLRYSEPTAYRYVSAARCVRRFPEAYSLLERRRVTVAGLSLVAGLLTPGNQHDLLHKIADKSQREVEAIVAGCRTGRPVRDRIKPVARVERALAPGRATTPEVGQGGTLSTPVIDQGLAGTTTAPSKRQPERDLHDEGENAPAGRQEPGRDDRRGQEPVVKTTGDEIRYKVEFGASAAFMKKFEEIRLLLASKFPGGAPLADMFEVLMDTYIERHSVRRRAERRKKRRGRAEERKRDANATGGDRNSEGRTTMTRKRGAANPHDERTTRHIPSAVRDAVHLRDRGRCTFVAPDGTRCRSRHDLEIDHIEPYALGGSNRLENLRLLCAVHNRQRALETYGSGPMCAKPAIRIPHLRRGDSGLTERVSDISTAPSPGCQTVEAGMNESTNAITRKSSTA